MLSLRKKNTVVRTAVVVEVPRAINPERVIEAIQDRLDPSGDEKDLRKMGNVAFRGPRIDGNPLGFSFVWQADERTVKRAVSDALRHFENTTFSSNSWKSPS